MTTRQMPHSALDCSRPAAAALWFLVGCAVALLFVRVAAPDLNRLADLLRLGTRNPRAIAIAQELSTVPPNEPTGHDGQLYYMVARDPFGRFGMPEAIGTFDNNGARYRYRRILFPLLAGGAGQFSPRMTLYAMGILAIGGIGLSAVGIADLCFRFRGRVPAVVLAVVNPGALISLWLLVADPLALGVSLCAVALASRERIRTAAVLCALASLTKETYVLVPCGLAVWAFFKGAKRDAATVLWPSVLALAVWQSWLVMRLPPDAGLSRNLGLPLEGLLLAGPQWVHERNPAEIVLAAYCVTTVLAATAVLSMRRTPSVIRWVAVPWLLLGALATDVVWSAPNNGARAIAVLWPLAIIGLGGAFAVNPSDGPAGRTPRIHDNRAAKTENR